MNIRTPALLAILLACASIRSLQAQNREDVKPHTLQSGLKLHEMRPDAKPDELDVYTSYEEAKRLEEEIVQMYREIRAAELSLIQQQTLNRSLESTLIPLSERAEVSQTRLTTTAADAEGVEIYQEELGVVMQETDAIVANAEDLLARFQEEAAPPPPTQTETPQEELTPEEIAAMAAQPPPDPQSLEMEPSPEQAQQQQADLQKEIEQNVDEAELNLEKALKEIQNADKRVQTEIGKVDAAIEEKKKEVKEADPEDPEPEQELAKEEEKREELEKLDEKIGKAENVVAEVVEKLKTLTEVPGEQIEKAEEVVKELREALAATLEADETVPESEEHRETREHTREAVAQVEAAQQSMEAAAQRMAELQTLSEMPAAMSGTPALSPEQNIARKQVLEALSRAESGSALDITAQMRGEDLNTSPVTVDKETLPPMQDLKNAPSVRKVVSGSDRGGEWIFIGDWYVLSRYDNRNRANIQKVYPPESVLELDAHYRSEDGKPMQWEYESFMPPMIMPTGWESWKIYYFYTELFFEEEAEVWLAIGSDDRSDIWINDLPIWHSSNEHKSWVPNEGFRKVFFKKGRNKVLVRLENGQHTLGFSLFMKLTPE